MNSQTDDQKYATLSAMFVPLLSNISSFHACFAFILLVCKETIHATI